MIPRTLSAALLCCAAVLVSAEPSIIVVNGKVFTGDRARPFAEAVAIEGNKVSAVGTDREIKALAREKTRVIDAQGRLVIPGFNDAHLHPGMATPAYSIASDLGASWSDVKASAASAIDETPADLWLTGTLGPGLVNDPSITSEKLDALAPGRKVMLTAFTGHGTVFSTTALKALGVTEDVKDPDGGWFERTSDGKLNGRVHEYAEYALRRRVADLASEDELIDDIRMLSEQALRYGITSVQAMPVCSEERFAQALAKANVPLRVRIIDFHLTGNAPVWKNGGALKWILDGTPVEQGAALRTTKYKDGSQGRENFRDLTPLVKMAVDNKLQLLVHAAGDKAVASALAAFAKAPALQRPRIEHGDGLQPDLFPLAKQTGAIVVLNPTHFPFSDSYPRGDYMLANSLLKAGIPIAIGSDGEMNPFLNLLLGSSRRDRPSESLTRMDLLRAYTSGSAFAELAETKKGQLAPGMLADLAILSQNVLDVDARSLMETTSVLTIIDGKVVYEQ
ncbi:MAG: amidohydrolase family protein [Acidobacteriota bacterium]